MTTIVETNWKNEKQNEHELSEMKNEFKLNETPM